MGSKGILENKSSLSHLISPNIPPSPTSACSASDFNEFHLPPSTTRIYPYTKSDGKNNNSNSRQKLGPSPNGSMGGVLGAFFWFALGTFISVLVMFVATQAIWWELPQTSTTTKGSQLCDPPVTATIPTSPTTDINDIKEFLVFPGSNGEKCLTEPCMKAASRILHRMNHTQSPCEGKIVIFHHFR